MRIARYHESSSTLEALSRVDKGPICHTYQSCKLTILEITEKPEQMNSSMAR